ncbi:MAG: GNAT family N-acetyltransferase [Candidatus Njordarchaeia archaeon]
MKVISRKGEKISIREYKPTDYNQILKLARKAFGDTPDARWAVSNLKRCVKVYLAIVRNKVVGAIQLEVSRLSEGLHGQIGYIFVDPDYRGMGIGSILVKRALEYFRSIRAKAVWALTNPSNTSTRILFSKFGFREITFQQMKKMFNKDDLKILLRDLYYWAGDVILYLEMQ